MRLHTRLSVGPSFKSDIKIKNGKPVMRNGYWLIDVMNLQ